VKLAAICTLELHIGDAVRFRVHWIDGHRALSQWRGVREASSREMASGHHSRPGMRRFGGHRRLGCPLPAGRLLAPGAHGHHQKSVMTAGQALTVIEDPASAGPRCSATQDAARAAGFRMLTAVRVEFEAQLPFAGLHQILLSTAVLRHNRPAEWSHPGFRPLYPPRRMSTACCGARRTAIPDGRAAGPGRRPERRSGHSGPP
jgi:hypothetical protein